MAALNINIVIGCEECRFADKYGRGCAHGLMRPVILAMSGQRCDLKQPKTNEQINEQINE